MHHSEHTITTGPRPTYLKSHASQSTFTIGPRPTYLKSHASQSTHNHHRSQADIPKITCITVNRQSPLDLCPHLWNYTHHRKHTIIPRPMSMYHMHHRKHNQHHIMCITQNTISIISCASHKTQSPPELCPHIMCITQNTISIISCASQKTQSPPELCPHIMCITQNTISIISCASHKTQSPP